MAALGGGRLAPAVTPKVRMVLSGARLASGWRGGKSAWQTLRLQIFPPFLLSAVLPTLLPRAQARVTAEVNRNGCHRVPGFNAENSGKPRDFWRVVKAEVERRAAIAMHKLKSARCFP